MGTLFSRAGRVAGLAACAALLSGCMAALPTVDTPLRLSACPGGAEAFANPSSAYRSVLDALAAHGWEVVDAQEETGFIEGRICRSTQCLNLIFQIDQETAAVDTFVPEGEKAPAALASKWIEELDASYDKAVCVP